MLCVAFPVKSEVFRAKGVYARQEHRTKMPPWDPAFSSLLLLSLCGFLWLCPHLQKDLHWLRQRYSACYFYYMDLSIGVSMNSFIRPFIQLTCAQELITKVCKTYLIYRTYCHKLQTNPNMDQKKMAASDTLEVGVLTGALLSRLNLQKHFSHGSLSKSTLYTLGISSSPWSFQCHL